MYLNLITDYMTLKLSSYKGILYTREYTENEVDNWKTL